MTITLSIDPGGTIIGTLQLTVELEVNEPTLCGRYRGYGAKPHPTCKPAAEHGVTWSVSLLPLTAAAIVAALRKPIIPAAEGVMGLDGCYFTLKISDDSFQESSFTWWSDVSKGWEPLGEVARLIYDAAELSQESKEEIPRP